MVLGQSISICMHSSRASGGYLAQYTEKIDPVVLTGPQIVDRIATDYSVNPRILLAVLEYQSHWVSRLNPDPATLDYPIGLKDTRRKGLYRQLAWAADNLNLGYYLWRVNGVASWILPDGNVVPISATINAGTAGVQNMFASLLGLSGLAAGGYVTRRIPILRGTVRLPVRPGFRACPSGQFAPANHAAAFRARQRIGPLPVVRMAAGEMVLPGLPWILHHRVTSSVACSAMIGSWR